MCLADMNMKNESTSSSTIVTPALSKVEQQPTNMLTGSTASSSNPIEELSMPEPFCRKTNLLDTRTVLYIAFYCCIGVFGIFGNLLTLLVLFKSKKATQTTTNIFIVSLSIADLLFLCFTIPTSIYYLQESDDDENKNNIGPITCRLIKWLEQFNMCGSVLTMVTMSTERFLAITYTMQAHALGLKSKKSALKAMAGVWLVGFLLSVPAYFTPETGLMINDKTQFNPHIMNISSVNETTRVFGDPKQFNEFALFDGNRDASWVEILKKKGGLDKNINYTKNMMQTYIEPMFINEDPFGKSYLERVTIRLKTTVLLQIINDDHEIIKNKTILSKVQKATNNFNCNALFAEDNFDIPEGFYSADDAIQNHRYNIQYEWSSHQDNCMFYIDTALYQYGVQDYIEIIIYEGMIFDIYNEKLLRSPDIIDKDQKLMVELRHQRFTEATGFVKNYTNLVPQSLTNFDKKMYETNGCIEFKPVCSFYPSKELPTSRRIYTATIYFFLYFLPSCATIYYAVNIAFQLLPGLKNVGDSIHKKLSQRNLTRSGTDRTMADNINSEYSAVSSSIKSTGTSVTGGGSCRSNLTNNTSTKTLLSKNHITRGLGGIDSSDLSQNGSQKSTATNGSSLGGSAKGRRFNQTMRVTNKKQARTAAKRKKQVLSMTIAVTFVFLVCWFFQQLSNVLYIIPGSENWLGSPKMVGGGEEINKSIDEMIEDVRIQTCSACESIVNNAKWELNQLLAQKEMMRNSTMFSDTNQSNSNSDNQDTNTDTDNTDTTPKTSFIFAYNEIWRMLAYLNSCINPFVYFGISKSFQDNLLKILGVRKIQRVSRRMRQRFKPKPRGEGLDKEDSLHGKKVNLLKE